MKVIDADTHVDECEDTWEFLNEKERRYKPTTVVVEREGAAGQPSGYNRHWLIDGRLRLRRIRDDARTGTTQATRELSDVNARLRDMDRLGTDVQVLYPTLFLTVLTEKPEVELALCRAYNRWLAERCGHSNGRLQWNAVMPLLNIDRAVEELRWAKDHGACGMFKKGVEAGSRTANDPYFFPLYEEASRLDMPVCIHIGSGDPSLSDSDSRFFSMYSTALPVVDALTGLAYDGIPELFPKLRVGFIEAGSSWLPYVLSELRARSERLAWMKRFDVKRDLLRECRFYVACQTQEDLPYILQHGAEDNLVIGSDYSHADQSAEIDALSRLGRQGESGTISQAQARKIVDENARALFGL